MSNQTYNQNEVEKIKIIIRDKEDHFIIEEKIVGTLSERCNNSDLIFT